MGAYHFIIYFLLSRCSVEHFDLVCSYATSAEMDPKWHRHRSGTAAWSSLARLSYLSHDLLQNPARDQRTLACHHGHPTQTVGSFMHSRNRPFVARRTEAPSTEYRCTYSRLQKWGQPHVPLQRPATTTGVNR